MREKYIAFLLIMVLVTIGFFALSASSYRNNIKQIDSYDAKIKNAQEKLNSARILDEQLSQFSLIIDNSLTRSKNFSFDEINDFKTKIGQMANDNRITINKLSDANKFTLAGLIETTYNMELECTFVEFGQFVSDLEALDNIIKIHYIDVSPAQTSDKNTPEKGAVSRYRVTVELSIFKVKRGS
jgi:Tfp pilus assembly protein PilO